MEVCSTSEAKNSVPPAAGSLPTPTLRFTPGERVVVVGRDAAGEKTYRTATVSTVRPVPIGDNKHSESGDSKVKSVRGGATPIRTTTLKVRFTGTARGGADEVLDERHLIPRNEESLRLKKEYEARSRQKPSGRAAGERPSVESTLPFPPTLPGARNDRAVGIPSSPLQRPRFPTPAAGTVAGTAGEAVVNSPRSLDLGVDASPGARNQQGRKRKTWETDVLDPPGIKENDSEASHAVSTNEIDLPLMGRGLAVPRAGTGGTSGWPPLGVRSTDIWGIRGKQEATSPLPSSSLGSPARKKQASAKKNLKGAPKSRKNARSREQHHADGSAVNRGEREGRHPPYADMAVEAVHTLGDSRGSSLSAMAIWIRGSRYAGLLVDQGNSAKEFKATVSVGVKQALDQGKLVKNRTNFRVSPEYALALARDGKANKTGMNNPREIPASSPSGSSRQPGAPGPAVERDAMLPNSGTKLSPPPIVSILPSNGGMASSGNEPSKPMCMSLISTKSTHDVEKLADERQTNDNGEMVNGDASGERTGFTGGRRGRGRGRGSRGVRDSRGGRSSRGERGRRGGKDREGSGRREGDVHGGDSVESTSAVASLRSGTSSVQNRTSQEWQRPAEPKDGSASPASVAKADIDKAVGAGAAEKGERVRGAKQPAMPTPRQKKERRSSLEAGGATSELVEDENLHYQENRDREAGGEKAPPPRPERPPPVHRMLVPEDAVGDLIAVWDFLKTFGPEIHAERLSRLTLDEFENAVVSDGEAGVNPVIAALIASLLREALGRNEDGSSSRTAENALESMKPVRRMLGDLLNAATWPEVLRRLASSHLRYCRALYSRHGQEEWPGKSHPLATAVELLERHGYGNLSTRQILGLLRWLSDTLMDSSAVRARDRDCACVSGYMLFSSEGPADDNMQSRVQQFKATGLYEPLYEERVNDHSERLSRLTLVERKRAEADKDRAFEAAASLNALAEARSCGQPMMSQEELETAEEAVRRGKELEQQEEAGLYTAVRREALGWDRDHNRYWWFQGDPSAHVHVESKGGASWGQYTTIEEAVALRDSLHPRGRRGGPLRRRLCHGMEEMNTSFEAVREEVQAKTKAREEVQRQEREKSEAEAAKAAAALAAAAAASAAMEAGEEPRRSGRKRPGPRPLEPESSVEETAKAARQKAKLEGERKATRAREVDGMNPYSPLLPAWKQRTPPPKAEEDIVRHLKFELTAMEEQLTKLGAPVGGGSTKAKKTWLREVSAAKDVLGIRAPAVQLEEAVYACTRDMTADLAMDWSSINVADGEDLSWKSPYDWSFLQAKARERRRGRDRERRGGCSGSVGGIKGSSDRVGDSGPGLAAESGSGALTTVTPHEGGDGLVAAPVTPARAAPRGKRKVGKMKREGDREVRQRAETANTAVVEAAAAPAVEADAGNSPADEHNIKAESVQDVAKGVRDGGGNVLRAEARVRAENIDPTVESLSSVADGDSATTEASRAQGDASNSDKDERDRNAVYTAATTKGEQAQVGVLGDGRHENERSQPSERRGVSDTANLSAIDDKKAGEKRYGSENHTKFLKTAEPTQEEGGACGLTPPSSQQHAKDGGAMRPKVDEEPSENVGLPAEEAEESKLCNCTAAGQGREATLPSGVENAVTAAAAVVGRTDSENPVASASSDTPSSAKVIDKTGNRSTETTVEAEASDEGIAFVARTVNDEEKVTEMTIGAIRCPEKKGSAEDKNTDDVSTARSTTPPAPPLDATSNSFVSAPNTAVVQTAEEKPNVDAVLSNVTKTSFVSANVETNATPTATPTTAQDEIAKRPSSKEEKGTVGAAADSSATPTGRPSASAALAKRSDESDGAHAVRVTSQPRDDSMEVEHMVIENSHTNISAGKQEIQPVIAAGNEANDEVEVENETGVGFTVTRRQQEGTDLAQDTGEEKSASGDVISSEGQGNVKTEGVAGGDGEGDVAAGLNVVDDTKNDIKNDDGGVIASASKTEVEAAIAVSSWSWSSSPSPKAPEERNEAVKAEIVTTDVETADSMEIDAEDGSPSDQATPALTTAVAAAKSVTSHEAAPSTSAGMPKSLEEPQRQDDKAPGAVVPNAEIEACGDDSPPSTENTAKKADPVEETEEQEPTVADNEGVHASPKERRVWARRKGSGATIAAIMEDERREAQVEQNVSGVVNPTTPPTKLAEETVEHGRGSAEQEDDLAGEGSVEEMEEEDEEEEVEPEKRWEMERESIAMANMQAELQGALSSDQSHREAWRTETLAAQTLAGVAIMVYAFVTNAAAVLPVLQEQDMQEQALIQNDVVQNQALHVRCSSTMEIIWARLHGFPWWPALVVKPDGIGFQRSLEESGDRLVAFMNEDEQFRIHHRFCKPFLGTSQDDIMRRVSRGNKRMAKAIKMSMKGLRVAYETLGPKRDPNAPQNRPQFDDPELTDVQPPPAPADVEGLERAGAAGLGAESDVAARPRRAPRRTQREVQDTWEAGATVEGTEENERVASKSPAASRGKKLNGGSPSPQEKSHSRKSVAEGSPPAMVRERQSSRKKKLTAVAQAAMDSGSMKLPSMRAAGAQGGGGGGDGRDDVHHLCAKNDTRIRPEWASLNGSSDLDARSLPRPPALRLETEIDMHAPPTFDTQGRGGATAAFDEVFSNQSFQRDSRMNGTLVDASSLRQGLMTDKSSVRVTTPSLDFTRASSPGRHRHDQPQPRMASTSSQEFVEAGCMRNRNGVIPLSGASGSEVSRVDHQNMDSQQNIGVRGGRGGREARKRTRQGSAQQRQLRAGGRGSRSRGRGGRGRGSPVGGSRHQDSEVNAASDGWGAAAAQSGELDSSSVNLQEHGPAAAGRASSMRNQIGGKGINGIDNVGDMSAFGSGTRSKPGSFSGSPRSNSFDDRMLPSSSAIGTVDVGALYQSTDHQPWSQSRATHIMQHQDQLLGMDAGAGDPGTASDGSMIPSMSSLFVSANGDGGGGDTGVQSQQQSYTLQLQQMQQERQQQQHKQQHLQRQIHEQQHQKQRQQQQRRLRQEMQLDHQQVQLPQYNSPLLNSTLSVSSNHGSQDGTLPLTTPTTSFFASADQTYLPFPDGSAMRQSHKEQQSAQTLGLGGLGHGIDAGGMGLLPLAARPLPSSLNPLTSLSPDLSHPAAAGIMLPGSLQSPLAALGDGLAPPLPALGMGLSDQGGFGHKSDGNYDPLAMAVGVGAEQLGSGTLGAGDAGFDGILADLGLESSQPSQLGAFGQYQQGEVGSLGLFGSQQQMQGVGGQDGGELSGLKLGLGLGATSGLDEVTNGATLGESASTGIPQQSQQFYQGQQQQFQQQEKEQQSLYPFQLRTEFQPTWTTGGIDSLTFPPIAGVMGGAGAASTSIDASQTRRDVFGSGGQAEGSC